jgi:hypothetical protein
MRHLAHQDSAARCAAPWSPSAWHRPARRPSAPNRAARHPRAQLPRARHSCPRHSWTPQPSPRRTLAPHSWPRHSSARHSSAPEPSTRRPAARHSCPRRSSAPQPSARRPAAQGSGPRCPAGVLSCSQLRLAYRRRDHARFPAPNASRAAVRLAGHPADARQHRPPGGYGKTGQADLARQARPPQSRDAPQPRSSSRSASWPLCRTTVSAKILSQRKTSGPPPGGGAALT